MRVDKVEIQALRAQVASLEAALRKGNGASGSEGAGTSSGSGAGTGSSSRLPERLRKEGEAAEGLCVSTNLSSSSSSSSFDGYDDGDISPRR